MKEELWDNRLLEIERKIEENPDPTNWELRRSPALLKILLDNKEQLARIPRKGHYFGLNPFIWDIISEAVLIHSSLNFAFFSLICKRGTLVDRYGKQVTISLINSNFGELRRRSIRFNLWGKGWEKLIAPSPFKKSPPLRAFFRRYMEQTDI